MCKLDQDTFRYKHDGRASFSGTGALFILPKKPCPGAPARRSRARLSGHRLGALRRRAERGSRALLGEPPVPRRVRRPCDPGKGPSRRVPGRPATRKPAGSSRFASCSSGPLPRRWRSARASPCDRGPPVSSSVPSGEKAAAMTRSVCPRKVARSRPVFTSQSLTVWSPAPETTVSPSGEKAREETLPMCSWRRLDCSGFRSKSHRRSSHRIVRNEMRGPKSQLIAVR